MAWRGGSPSPEIHLVVLFRWFNIMLIQEDIIRDAVNAVV